MKQDERPSDRRIAFEAGEWLEKLKKSNAADREAFADWVTASPRHIEEFLLHTAFRKNLNVLFPPTRARSRKQEATHRKTHHRVVERGWTDNVAPLRPAAAQAQTPPQAAPGPSPKPRRLRKPFFAAGLPLLQAAALGAVYLLTPQTAEYSTTTRQERRVEFKGQTLAEVVAELNRYNSTQLLIADPAIAARRIYGSFPVTDIESLLLNVKALFGIEAVRSPPGEPATLHLTMSAPSATGAVTPSTSPARPAPARQPRG